MLAYYQEALSPRLNPSSPQFPLSILQKLVEPLLEDEHARLEILIIETPPSFHLAYPKLLNLNCVSRLPISRKIRPQEEETFIASLGSLVNNNFPLKINKRTSVLKFPITINKTEDSSLLHALSLHKKKKKRKKS